MAKETKDLETVEKSAKKSTKKTTKKAVAKKSTSTTKNATTTKKKTEATKKTTAKKTTVDKKTTVKSATKKATTKKTESSVKKNTTLAQTPKMLFIYWEISEEDRDIFKKLYGENFFNHTKPVLVVYNDTMNYSFEVEVDDFANSWYLHIENANCEYHVELGRKPIQNINRQNQPIYIPYYVYVTSSNEMTSPNNTILFDPNIKTITFRNIKTGEVIKKDINQFKFITNVGIFNVKELYKYLFPNENFEFENIVLGNTSSGALSSSGMFSSQFK